MIEVTELRKRFGAAVALDGMTFRVLPGQVTGFVGPNGAGKSTTMRVILDLDAADSGTALVEGQRYRTLRDPLTHVGSLLDAGALQASRTARNHLLWLAYSQQLPARRVDAVLEQVGLSSVARRRAGGFSLGIRQRLGTAAALLGDPRVLMFDEPFNGMDPEGIVWLRLFLRSLAREGRAVLVSSHLMSELEDAADHVIVVGRGRVIADSSVADLLAAVSDGRVTVLTTAGPRAAEVLRQAGGEVSAEGNDALLVSGIPSERIVVLLSSHAIPVAGVTAHRATLEQAYLTLTRDLVDYRGAGYGSAQ
jgi:ABC-2 type transport system ATP-binding protein